MDGKSGWTNELPWLGQYVLDEDGNPVKAKSLLEWAAWMETDKRRVAFDKIGNATVSTIFMGLDTASIFERDLPHEPVLWETMVFGGPYDLLTNRYTSKEEALRGHARIVQMLTS